jgi:hypothetical protein
MLGQAAVLGEWKISSGPALSTSLAVLWTFEVLIGAVRLRSLHLTQDLSYRGYKGVVAQGSDSV